MKQGPLSTSSKPFQVLATTTVCSMEKYCMSGLVTVPHLLFLSYNSQFLLLKSTCMKVFSIISQNLSPSFASTKSFIGSTSVELYSVYEVETSANLCPLSYHSQATANATIFCFCTVVHLSRNRLHCYFCHGLFLHCSRAVTRQVGTRLRLARGVRSNTNNIYTRQRVHPILETIIFVHPPPSSVCQVHGTPPRF